MDRVVEPTIMVEAANAKTMMADDVPGILRAEPFNDVLAVETAVFSLSTIPEGILPSKITIRQTANCSIHTCL